VNDLEIIYTDIPMDEREASPEPIERPLGWSEASHEDLAAPNYEVVFPKDKVNQIKIIISPEEWETMQNNMTKLFGEAGTGEEQKGFPGQGAEPLNGQPIPHGMPIPGDWVPPEGQLQPAEGGVPERPGGNFPGGQPEGRGFGGGDMTPENPIWVSATIEFEGQTWTHVGVRYKGNSSLMSGWRSGSLKLPMKLDFDEFEDSCPEITNQRFYGFKQLSLANGFGDPSFLRDAATSLILEKAGLPAAETAFYQVTLDYGEGAVDLGLYTMIEVVDDTLIPSFFGSNDGNIYEANGPAASFAASTFDQIEVSFEKENNENEADWSDIKEFYTVLHSGMRLNDPEAWREALESLFDVEGFLEWLAISAVIQHWDAYGNMAHNYYLYHDPESGRLTWISWDHNMALSAGMGEQGGRGRMRGSASLDKAEVEENWPLIRFLLDDPVYYNLYLTFLEETIMGPFNPEDMTKEYQNMANLIAPFASTEIGEATFNTAVQQLIEQAQQQAEAVEEFLQSVNYQPILGNHN